MMIIARENYIDQLIDQGYGSNRNVVMEYLLDRAIDELLRCKVLTPLSQSKGGSDA